MISHVAEVWVALFAAFVVGSLLGWLIYRWVDRSDLAFHHDDAAKPAARRRSEAVPDPVAAEAGRPAQRQPVPRPRPAPVAREPAAREPASATVGAGQLRTRISQVPPPDRTGVREVRPAPAPPPPPSAAPRPAQPTPRPVVPQRVGEPPPALSLAARLLRARSLPPVERTGVPVPAPSRAERPQTAARSDMPLPTIAPSSVQHEEPWQAPPEPWPIERRAPSAPAGGGAQGSAFGRAAVLDSQPKHDEIWISSEPEPSGAAQPFEPRPGPAVGEEEPERIVWQPPPESEPHPKLEDDYRDAPLLSALEPEEAPTAAPGVAPTDIAETVRPPSVPPPSRPDDFKQIKGIGPAFERKLNQLGIYHYAQIAAWSAAEQAWVGNEFGFAGRIERDDWVGQAAALAAEAAAATVSNPVRD